MKRLTERVKICDLDITLPVDISMASATLDKLADYEDIGLEPDELKQLQKNEEYWHRDAIRLAAELGEIKIRLGKFIECNSNQLTND